MAKKKIIWLAEPVVMAPVRYLLRDDFRDTRAAGAVNGTPATPGPGTRTVVDTESKLSVGSGGLNFAGGKTAPAYGDPGIWYNAVTRVKGRILLYRFTLSSMGNIRIGPTSLSGNGTTCHGIKVTGGGSLQTRNGSTDGPAIGSVSTATAYTLACVLRDSGAYAFFKGGAFSQWNLLWVETMGSATPLYPANANYDAVFSDDFIRIPQGLFMPTPVAYDTFTRANGALGSTEATGPDGQASPTLAWGGSGSTWAVDTNQAKNTPSLGSELEANGNMEVDSDWTSLGTPTTQARSSEQKHGGSYSRKVVSDATGEGFYTTTANINAAGAKDNWFQFDGWLYLTAGDCSLTDAGGGVGSVAFPIITTTGAWVHQTVIARGQNFSIYIGAKSRSVAASTFFADDLSVKQLTAAELFQSVVSSSSNVVASVEITLAGAPVSAQAGLVICLDSQNSPANFLIAYHDGTNAKLDKCVNGTYTNLISAAATYAAGARLVVVKSGSNNVSLYYNEAQVGMTQTVNDTEIVSNTLHGLFSTYNGNRLDKFTLFARGNGGEYAGLDKYIN